MKQLNLFLIEDSQDDQLLTLRVMRKLPFVGEIQTASNGAEALKRLLGPRTQRPDPFPNLVLLDLQLPKVSGLEILMRLRVNAATRSLPVFILTASDNTQDIETCRELGANAYMIKPIDGARFAELASRCGFT